MASIGVDIKAFDATKLYPSGLDLARCEILRARGTWKANAAGSFRAGAPVMLNSSGEVVLADNTSLLGVAKWPKMSLGKSLVVDEEVNFVDASATVDLAHPGISNVAVRSAVEGGGTQYTVTTDYTLNTTNGTITHVAIGSIDEAAPVYVSYTWSLTADDYLFEGSNFWNVNDNVTIQDGHITVVQAPAKIFTTEFDTSKIYTKSGSGSNVYVNSSGVFTSTSSSNILCGYCINIPSAGDPYLGIDFIGMVAAHS